MQGTYGLRKFAINDLASVTQINAACLPENYTDIFFVDLYRRNPETFVVAEQDGKVVGYIMCRIEMGLSSMSLSGVVKKGHVVSVAVLPEYRRKRVGTALVTKAMEGMQMYGAKQFYLEVRVSNKPAIDLYQSFNFKVLRTIRGYYRDGEDAYVMSRSID